jgi:hypothetical protein
MENTEFIDINGTENNYNSNSNNNIEEDLQYKDIQYSEGNNDYSEGNNDYSEGSNDSDFVRISENNVENKKDDDEETENAEKYLNILNIFNEINLERIKFHNEYFLRENKTHSLSEWLTLSLTEVNHLIREVIDLHSNDNDIYSIRVELLKLAAILVSWIEVLSITNYQKINKNENNENNQNQNQNKYKERSRDVNTSGHSSHINPNINPNKMCTDCTNYLYTIPKAFCNNLEHVRYPRS